MQRFDFRFTTGYRLAGLLFTVTPRTTWVQIADGRLTARFGPWRLNTPLANIRDVAITGPYHFIKTAGPAHLGLTDRGLTFATNGRSGVRLTFVEGVTGIDPLGLIKHPELTVTVSDIDGLAAAVAAG